MKCSMLGLGRWSYVSPEVELAIRRALHPIAHHSRRAFVAQVRDGGEVRMDVKTGGVDEHDVLAAVPKSKVKGN